MDERDGEEEGDDGGSKEERSARCLVSQMGEEWEDGVIYVRTTNVFRQCIIKKGTAETHTKPMRFWMPCRLACQIAVPSKA